MSATYNASMPGASPKDEVRTFLNDVGQDATGNEIPFVFTDEQINWYLNSFFNNDSCRTAVWLMRSHAVRLALQLGFSRSIGEMSISNDGGAATYTKALANELEEMCRARGSAPVTIPFNDKNVPVPPLWWRGMHDQPSYPLTEYDPDAAGQYFTGVPYDPYTGP